MKKLSSEELKETLTNSENRQIIRMYNEADQKRLDESVFSPLIPQHPSLIGIVEQLRKEYDPIESLERIGSQATWIGGTAKFILPLANLLDDNDEGTVHLKHAFSMIPEFIDICSVYIPTSVQFYANIAHAVKSVSSQRNVGLEEAVTDLRHRDDVFRIAMPSRSEAELFANMSFKYLLNSSDMARGLIAFERFTGREDETTANIARLVPEPEAVDALGKGVLNYRMSEFDRIYSP